jgi:serine/threonine protein kinase
MEDLYSDNIDYDRYLIEPGLIGTPEYLSPESLIEGESSPAVDLWALGCIIYLFFHGSTPFKDKTNKLIFNRIENIEYFLDENLNEDIKDIIKKLLVRNPMERLGYGPKEFNLDFSALKSHCFFKGINWDNLNDTNPPIFLKKLLYKNVKNNSTDNLIGAKYSISESPSVPRKSNLNLIIIENDSNKNININNFNLDINNNLNINLITECHKDFTEEYEIILKKNEIRKSIKKLEALKDEILYEGNF